MTVRWRAGRHAALLPFCEQPSRASPPKDHGKQCSCSSSRLQCWLISLATLSGEPSSAFSQPAGSP